MAQDSTWDHWWWRPGWRLGRSFYTWHVTFAENSPVARLVDLFAPTLAQIPTMDAVSREGLHVTIQGIGFTDEVAAGDVERIADAASEHLSRREPFDASIGPPTVDEETIGMPIANPEGFQWVRNDLQQAIADVWGLDNVPERDDRFQPHLTLAYSTGAASMTSLRDILTRNQLSHTEVVEHVTAVSLIELNRDNHRYEWREIAKVPLGTPRSLEVH
ncbi:2'-5' RNA ligase family protein [Nocardia vinacea]|uniref:2'-5' RNA ligase family protein n=1 Tax=Nocardia vinacea TaxID=96468 RepID=UPI00031FB7DE|nr:2'-5' RNA ligase family protein [Nocardia vinacea]